MAFRLTAVAGPLKGSAFPLVAESLSIGRDAANDVSIGDAAVSRNHTVLKRDGDRVAIFDLDSLNGTFVNGVPVKERLLEKGDQIEIGGSLFLFLADEDESPSARAEGPLELPVSSTIRLERKDAVYARPEALRQAAIAPERLRHDVALLLETAAAAGSASKLDELGERVLRRLLDALPASRGALLVREAAGDDVVSVVTKGPSETALTLPAALVEQVLKDGSALFGSEPPGATETGRGGVRAFMVAPITTPAGVPALVYLDTTEPGAAFKQADLQLLTGVAALLGLALDRVRRLQWLEEERGRVQADLAQALIGESPAMRQVHDFVARVAASDATVLIRGESGTGKEVVARAVHRTSARASGPFVAINCAALTESLLESELFGHEQGAFTGAVARKRGKLEMAQGGTVFLDEVGELAPALQAKLLRVLQEREFERVGGTQVLKADLRVLAATNRDLEEAMKTGAFRRDLFYRLNVVSVTVPPLRHRREDIPLLASYFLARHGRRMGRPLNGLSAEARALLLAYDWPGNVRELDNAIERAVVLGGGGAIRPEDLPEALLESQPAGGPATTYHEAVNEAKRGLIKQAMSDSGGSYVAAARRLGLHPNYLHRLIRNLDLKGALRR